MIYKVVSFSTMFYQRILNIVPRAIQWGLLSIPIFNFNNGKILLHLLPPSFSLFSSGAFKSELLLPFSFSPTFHQAPKSCQSLFLEATPGPPSHPITPRHTSASAYSADLPSLLCPLPGPAQGWSISDDFVFTLFVCSRTCSARGSGGLSTPQAPSPSSQLLVFMHMCPWCAGSSEDHTVWPPHSKASYPPSQGTDFHVTSFLSQGHMCLFDLAYLDCTFLSFSLSFLM